MTETEGRPKPKPGLAERRFAEKVIFRGLVTQKQVDLCLRTREKHGTLEDLGELLVKYGFMTEGQLKRLREEVDPATLVCPRCEARLSFPRTAPDDPTPTPTDEQETRPIPPFTTPVGMEVGGCKIEALIARGATASVYRARHLGLDRDVAVKMMPFSGRKEADIKRLLYEARSVAKLEHLNIVQVYDVGFQRGFFFIVMQLLQGEVLEHLLEDRGAIPQAEALEIAHQVLRGLAEAHGKGIIHRDVKPSNIVLGEDGQARLTDFGLAQDVEDAQDKTPGQIAGTPFYVAPEVWLGHRADERSDLYSLGICLYQMTTGKKPFAGRTVAEVMHRHLKSVPPSPKEIVPALSDGFNAMVRKAMAKAPGRRYETAAEFLDDLVRVKRGDDPIAMVDFGNFIKCGFCEALNPEREKKCSVCGEKLRMYGGPLELKMFKDEFKCPSCTTVLKKGTRECIRCGMQFCIRCRLRKAELKGYCPICLPHAEKKKR